MAKVIKSSHPTKHYSDGGAVSEVLETGSNEWMAQKAKEGATKVLEAFTKPSVVSDAAGAAVAAEVRKKREAAETAEGARLKNLPAPKKKPYTNPDGTPFTREQMRKHLGR
ncbi:MAG TPA: hypothetical protein VJ022_13540 [Anaerolineales bacterium]|nr:hypothetical protein [Anaerolineales bacterium]